jgi:hypothetical protein
MAIINAIKKTPMQNTIYYIIKTQDNERWRFAYSKLKGFNGGD